MKNISLVIAIFALTTTAKALGGSTFSSNDVKSIKANLEILATGQQAKIQIESGEATCRVNSMAELPGYRCSIGIGDLKIDLTSTDIANVEEALANLATGQGIALTLDSGASVSCRNNSMAELPGYRCSIAK